MRSGRSCLPISRVGNILKKDHFAVDTLEACFEPDIKRDCLVAWAKNERVACYIATAATEEQSEEGMSFHYHAESMKDRCHGIRGLRGNLCRYQWECPLLSDLDWISRDP